MNVETQVVRDSMGHKHAVDLLVKDIVHVAVDQAH